MKIFEKLGEIFENLRAFVVKKEKEELATEGTEIKENSEVRSQKSEVRKTEEAQGHKEFNST